jgi:hypothetical protein
MGQVHVLDLSLQLAAALPRHLAAEDHGNLVRPSDGPAGLE